MTDIYQVTRSERFGKNAKLLFLGTNDECFSWLLRHQPASVHHATKYEGYKIEPMKIYTLQELEGLSTLDTGHFDNLKVQSQNGNIRIWLSRMTREDGAPYDNQVTVEQYNGHDWVAVDKYQAQ